MKHLSYDSHGHVQNKSNGGSLGRVNCTARRIPKSQKCPLLFVFSIVQQQYLFSEITYKNTLIQLFGKCAYKNMECRKQLKEKQEEKSIVSMYILRVVIAQNLKITDGIPGPGVTLSSSQQLDSLHARAEPQWFAWCEYHTVKSNPDRNQCPGLHTLSWI